MSCREFEHVLDELLAARPGPAGPGAAVPWSRLEGHAAGCTACAELLELARLPQPDAIDVAGPVLAKTAGGACRQVESSLNEFVNRPSGDAPDPLGASGSRDLIALHLEHCHACAGLAEELERLSLDLPRLAVVEPEVSLVASVLRRTLPVTVQLRRWWTSTWPRWVRRPRFAVECAFAATLVLVVLFATPGSPLQAMPERAAGLVNLEALEQLETLPDKAQGGVVSGLRSVGSDGKRLATRLVTSAQSTFGTITQEAASWFVIAEDDSTAQDQEPKERP